MWQPLLNVQKYRWLKHSVYGGSSSQSSLMATIVEFVLKEEPLDVEKMRKCLLKQVTVVCVCVSVCVSVFHLKPDPCSVCSVCAQLERAEVRLEGIDTMLKLASKNFLLPSVQYAMLCGWQRVVPEGTDNGSVSSLHRLRCYKKMKIYSSVPVPELAVGLHRTPPPSTAVALPPVLT